MAGKISGESSVFETRSAKETYDLGRRFGENASSGEIYALYGELGAGKTVFAQGFASGLNITEPVTSPTFTVLQVYEGGRLTLYHFDLYRVEDESEMDEIGFDEYVYADGVALIEWPLRAGSLLPKKRTDVYIKTDPKRGFNCRVITIAVKGE